MRIFDSNYSDWKPGDKVVWEEKRNICPLFTIAKINDGKVLWETKGGINSAHCEWLVRVTETKIDTANMTELEKLINDLCGLPKYDLEGDEDTIAVRWEQGYSNNNIFIALEEWNECVYLDPTQGLTLLDWLGSQRQNLEQLRDALQAKQSEEEATREQREAERLNALKVKHSDAVTAWQEGGCVGQCPSFEATR